MSITLRVTRRVYERVQLAPDVRRRTSVSREKLDGATHQPSEPNLRNIGLSCKAFQNLDPPETSLLGFLFEEIEAFEIEAQRRWNFFYLSTREREREWRTTGVRLTRNVISLVQAYANARKRVRFQRRTGRVEDCSAIVTKLELSREDGHSSFFLSFSFFSVLFLLLFPFFFFSFFFVFLLSFPRWTHGRISIRRATPGPDECFPSRNSLAPARE